MTLPDAKLTHGEAGRRTFTIFIRPPHPACSDNARVHRMVKAKHVRELRQEAFAACKMIETPKFNWGVAHVRYVLGKPVKGQYRPIDHFNAGAAVKGAIDGMIDAGVLPDDNLNYLLSATCEIVKEEGSVSRVEISITEIWL